MTSSKTSKAGPGTYLFALVAMGAAVVFVGPKLDGLRHKGAQAQSVGQSYAYEPEVAQQEFVQAAQSPSKMAGAPKLSDKLPVIYIPIREFNMSAMPVRQKDPGAWGSDDSMRSAEQARVYEQEQAKVIEEAQKADRQAQLDEQAKQLTQANQGG